MPRIGFTPPADPRAVLYKVGLQISEPNKEDDTWSLTATAVVSDTDNRAIQGAPVQFYHNGSRVDEPVETESDGRATKEFSGLGKGNHTFEAQIVNTDRKSRQKITIKELKPKSPRKLVVEISGRDGKYDFSISTLSEDGVGIKGVVICIMDPDGSPRVHDRETDKHGAVRYNLSFPEKERFLTITVPGTDLVWKKKLFGPRQQPKRKR